ncbi:hypothetical protein [Parabacteroides pacaensis]|uniref:hypothetical protein n=1 Tax=Parabacteroides pacaensis TaxID=2086575 RepID=UPI00131C3B2F|nr:hypothetical protein [Parabacteroides pacaensis]
MDYKIYTLLGLLLFVINIYGQTRLPIYVDMQQNISYNTPFQNEDFLYKQTNEWKKHKILQACGWSAFGIGGAMMIVGFVGDVVKNWEGTEHNSQFKILGYTGIGITTASIPLFIFSHKNKKKAFSIHTACQTIYVPAPNGIIQQRPSVSISFKF